ncbi:hypothetical protein B0T25DRAFT_364582 [Lasiosphaeria hispida]|uniref:Uncharacterized protein n=1 Tax=Lasiosphaeria hispida TaxID=260671 RepID=A0AAJ0H5C2_9PEZI|nr:hypothetical protein B0T25DRAFT_364582 [Lasiosphaeria hispida]
MPIPSRTTAALTRLNLRHGGAATASSGLGCAPATPGASRMCIVPPCSGESENGVEQGAAVIRTHRTFQLTDSARCRAGSWHSSDTVTFIPAVSTRLVDRVEGSKGRGTGIGPKEKSAGGTRRIRRNKQTRGGRGPTRCAISLLASVISTNSFNTFRCVVGGGILGANCERIEAGSGFKVFWSRGWDRRQETVEAREVEKQWPTSGHALGGGALGLVEDGIAVAC